MRALSPGENCGRLSLMKPSASSLAWSCATTGLRIGAGASPLQTNRDTPMVDRIGRCVAISARTNR